MGLGLVRRFVRTLGSPQARESLGQRMSRSQVLAQPAAGVDDPVPGVGDTRHLGCLGAWEVPQFCWGRFRHSMALEASERI
jgi:hypothetical protein